MFWGEWKNFNRGWVNCTLQVHTETVLEMRCYCTVSGIQCKDWETSEWMQSKIDRLIKNRKDCLNGEVVSEKLPL